ncbi:LysE family translocator [Vogesella sp. LIG4]|uniref:LysE family translocator n=1 Tax=Vogesella sp. LIG4 TaxID=1192162 RepID=UPI00081FE6AC|nr:LysE family translocator [Vogesella sp. LIG4]SCK13398.1 Threonine/homoserine/homoserine lactone efflux protein [Vogesella sp. LIG4]
MLLSPEQLLAFLPAAVLITLSPGPDNLMVLSLGVARGRKSGMVFGLGCALGCLSHTLLAALGVSALIAATPWALLGLKVLGGGYLVWLGWQALHSAGSRLQPAQQGGAEPSLRQLFGKGLVANAVNPKVILFFLAFLPQFISGSQHAAWQTAQLGVLFTLQAAVLFGSLGYFAGHAGRWLNTSPRRGMWLDRLAGTVFIGLGLRLLVVR